MRIALLGFLFLGAVQQHTFAQKIDSLALTMDIDRRVIDRTAMKTLAIWSGSQIASGLVLAATQDGWQKQFFGFNAAWNVVNGTLAYAGLMRLRNEEPASDPVLALHRYTRTERILMLNCGLDLAYIATGFALNNMAKNTSAGLTYNRLKGYGTSLYLQGGFLLLFDGIYALALKQGSDYYRTILRGLWFRGNAVGLDVRF
ncbi:MAG: DUF6992 family protein [Bacteroidia bacterium]|jgi:hypothetical protein